MRIEIEEQKFNQISLTIESQDDLNKFVSLLTYASETIETVQNENEQPDVATEELAEMATNLLDVLEPLAT